MTVEARLSHWLGNIAAPSVRPKTLAGYRTAVRQHLIPGIGQHSTDRLQPEHIGKLYAKLRAKGLKPATVHQVHRTLRTALNEAVRRGQIARNPATLAKAPRVTEEKIQPFTMTEAQRILTATAGRRNGVRIALPLALGLCQSETFGLQWRDVDLEHGTLTIRRTIQRLVWQHGCGGTCGRKRGADCPPGAMAAWSSPRPRRGLAGGSSGCRPSRPESRSTHMSDYAERQALLKAAVVRPARLRDARHTAATMLLVLKVPTRAVMDVMGWSQVSMTSRYQQVPAEVLIDIAVSVGGLLWGSQPQHVEAPPSGP